MSRKIFLYIMVGLLMQSVFAIPVLANSTVSVEEKVLKDKAEDDSTSDIIPFADKIVKKYRMYNGKWQYRRWNATKECWVDPYWIDM